ncbi:MAG TPA: tetratricopeptide repeat protein [Archangium sp.]|uniref:tetratricopeptide repeat protein n=1 Tax=Archangium sp. TaxID=1872627 RepID=UPI002E311952|nr:tetratricopeptide repeat protein [Archangium sp.]HEX5753056.1 tetratricopeptide repeat protein [Archangium sp.]
MNPGLLVAALLAEPGLCGPVTPLSPPDPAAAAPYVEVAEAEQAAGDTETALVAWREVLRRDPRNARARAALKTLCRGDWAEEQAEAAAASLLSGLSHFERGEDAAAAAAFHEALAEPELVDTASFFLGVLALREGRTDEAGTFFDAAATSPDEGLARRAGELRLRAAREGRVSFSGRLGGEYDSNVDLAPDGTLRQGGSGDGVSTALAELSVRPWGQRGPYARVSGNYRGHLRFPGFDLAGAGGALGQAHLGPVLQGTVEYGLDYLALGGAPYLLAHRLRGAARVPVGPVVLEGSAAVRREDFLVTAYEGYSGWRGTMRLDAEWSPTESLTLSAGWCGGLLRTYDLALGYVEHGPRAGLSLGLGPGLRMLGEVGYSPRGYQNFDNPLGARREDGILDASAVLEWDVSRHWSVQASMGWRGASSNVPELSYGRFTGGLALVWSRGLF